MCEELSYQIINTSAVNQASSAVCLLSLLKVCKSFDSSEFLNIYIFN